MKFSLQLPTDRVEHGDEFTSAGAIAELAEAIEAAGFDACWVTEHPFPSDEWMATGGHHSLDPFVALTAAAVATKTLRLHTNILVLPYRNPFLTAKAAASLDVVSGGRVIVGVAAGYLEGEYAALGANFADRNAITDEALVAIKQAWKGESMKLDGRDFQVSGNTMLPRPVQQPHPPVWVGGNSSAAIRRTAEHAQGWSPFPIPGRFAGRIRTAGIETLDDLRERIEYLRDYARQIGRSDRIDVNFVPFGSRMNSQDPLDPKAFREQLAELESIGVTWLSLGVPGVTRAAYLDSIARFGAEVIGRTSVARS
ncbi:MAG: TIGR03619 family F420-dependent LLM class oxidoreductase [Myxococcota bacterium]